MHNMFCDIVEWQPHSW